MRRFLFLVSAAAACGIVACEKRPALDSAEDQKRQEQREADERRLAELKDLEQRAADRDAAAALAELDNQRAVLAAERAKLEQDRANLDEEQRRVADARLAKIREEERENERREELRRTEQRKRDQQLAETQVANQRAEQTLDFFYDALDPEGDWIEVERYGYCWQPRVARQGSWRPYLDGHWAYTNYGWTWVSNEPFGWATYHYGRWTRVRGLGWVWVPGSEWAPAWVSWRRNDRHVGWAPLPPEAYSRGGFTAAVESRYDIGPGFYNFVAVENFGAPTYVREVLQPEQNITMVRQTVNVTNITYQNVDNRVIVRNEGPQFAEINQRAKVRRMNVERVSQGQPGKAVESGDTLRMHAPVVAPAAKETQRPKRVRENVKAPEMERGWGGASAGVVAEVREQQKEEARKSSQGRPEPRPGAPGTVSQPKPEAPKPPASKSATGESKEPNATTQPGETARPPRGSRPTEPPAGSSATEPARKPPVTPPKPDADGVKPSTAPTRPVPQPVAGPDSANPPATKPEVSPVEGQRPGRKPGDVPPPAKELKPFRPASDPKDAPAAKPQPATAPAEKPSIPEAAKPDVPSEKPSAAGDKPVPPKEKPGRDAEKSPAVPSPRTSPPKRDVDASAKPAPPATAEPAVKPPAPAETTREPARNVPGRRATDVPWSRPEKWEGEVPGRKPAGAVPGSGPQAEPPKADPNAPASPAPSAGTPASPARGRAGAAKVPAADSPAPPQVPTAPGSVPSATGAQRVNDEETKEKKADRQRNRPGGLRNKQPVAE